MIQSAFDNHCLSQCLVTVSNLNEESSDVVAASNISSRSTLEYGPSPHRSGNRRSRRRVEEASASQFDLASTLTKLSALTVVIVFKGIPVFVRWINVDTVDLFRKLLLQRLEPRASFAKDKPVVEISFFFVTRAFAW